MKLYERFLSPLQLLAVATSFAALSTTRADEHSLFCNVPDNNEPSYAVVIDAGSSGSRSRIFTWDEIDGPITEVFAPEDSEAIFKVEPGLSSFAPSGQGAGESLAPIIEAAKTLVPQESWPNTPLYVLSTGGVRLLEPASARTNVLNNAETYLKDPTNSPFSLQAVAVTSGEEEATFGYLSINADTSDPTDWYGVMDMGGATTQIAFLPENDVRGNSQTIIWDQNDLEFFAQSYPGLGQNDARATYLEMLTKDVAAGGEVVMADCYSPNYQAEYDGTDPPITLQGTGNGQACMEQISNWILHLGYKCGMPPCGVKGSHVAVLHGDFIAFSGFYYSALNMGLIPDGEDSIVLTQNELMDAALGYCAEDLPEDANSFQENACFLAIYASALLGSYGFDEYTNGTITFTQEFNGRKADWALGALVSEREYGILSCHPGSSSVDYEEDLDVANIPELGEDENATAINRNGDREEPKESGSEVASSAAATLEMPTLFSLVVSAVMMQTWIM